MKKILKGIFLFIGLFLIVIIIAILFPLSSIGVPKKHSSILIKSMTYINLIGIK